MITPRFVLLGLEKRPADMGMEGAMEAVDICSSLVVSDGAGIRHDGME